MTPEQPNSNPCSIQWQPEPDPRSTLFDHGNNPKRALYRPWVDPRQHPDGHNPDAGSTRTRPWIDPVASEAQLRIGVNPAAARSGYERRTQSPDRPSPDPDRPWIRFASIQSCPPTNNSIRAESKEDHMPRKSRLAQSKWCEMRRQKSNQFHTASRLKSIKRPSCNTKARCPSLGR